jgi:hypothetical protein
VAAACGKVDRSKVVGQRRGKQGPVVWALALALALTAATVQAGLQPSGHGDCNRFYVYINASREEINKTL